MLTQLHMRITDIPIFIHVLDCFIVHNDVHAIGAFKQLKS